MVTMKTVIPITVLGFSASTEIGAADN